MGIALKLPLRELGYGKFAPRIGPVMARYNLFLYNQHARVRYPATLNLPDIDAARLVAQRVANTFMEVVPYWGDLTADQQGRYVVEIVGVAGELLLTVPFKDKRKRRLRPLRQIGMNKKKPHQDSSADGAGEFREEWS